jgi:ApbE superfamily uncharacterized protein (UPF0280 family)
MKKPSDYTDRLYRKWQKPEGLFPFHVQEHETDLHIFAASKMADKALELTRHYRGQLEETIRLYPVFRSSLKPMHIESPHPMIRDMIHMSEQAGVGPMAGVAGAIAEYVGLGLLAFSPEIIVENGGDIFMKTDSDRKLQVYAGEASPFRENLILRLTSRQEPYGICTSSGRIGHSFSSGDTDATVVIAQSAITADVFATAIGNTVQREADIDRGLAMAENSGVCSAALIVMGERVGVWGDIAFAT